MILSAAKLTDKHQITIPAEVRRRLGLAAGDVVILALEADQVVLRAERGGWTQSSRGLGAELWRREGGGEAAIERERESWE
ncbi:MAG TPA: AbrB/MazE/SpoVT family DNA-binding domain-containing protein [Thermoanaerobaculia bacterium]|jgi:AbrB family looped-hinge helix DNA binding protein